jgi:hypothetical protein
MGKYSSSPTWSSIAPIPLDDGSSYYSEAGEGGGEAGGGSSVHPLATIAYSPDYVEATAYLRAVMAANEMSERALELTEDVIRLNPAHYTVWYVSFLFLFPFSPYPFFFLQKKRKKRHTTFCRVRAWFALISAYCYFHGLFSFPSFLLLMDTGNEALNAVQVLPSQMLGISSFIIQIKDRLFDIRPQYFIYPVGCGGLPR